MGESDSMLIKGRMTKENVTVKTSSRTGEAAILNMPKGLQIGTSLQGQVVSIQGNEIELLLKGEAKIVARLEQNMQVSLNQILNFEVKRTNNVLILRPLFKNLGQDINLVKALQDASMPASDKNLEMVQILMQKGMAINKQALNELNRQMTLFPNASGKELIEMKEMSIPITKENISQFISYKGMNHYLTDSFQGIASSFQKGMEGMLQEGNEKGIQTALNKLNQLVIDKQVENLEVEGRKGSSNHLKEGMIKEINEGISKKMIQEDIGSNRNINISSSIHQKLVENIYTVLQKKTNIDVNLGETTEIEAKSNGKILIMDIYNLLEKANFPEQLTSNLKEAEINIQKIFQLIEAFANNKDFIPELKGIIQTEAFKKGIQELLEGRCLLDPKDFADKEMVKESYQLMKEQATILQQIGETMGKQGESLQSTASSLQNNLEFINQLNQTFNYIQIPLKNEGNKRNGELFVYAKKKTAIEKGEEVSALLHLNMKNLGMMDIHVKMELGKVKTHFFLEKDSAYDFIALHLPELDAAIEKRGYVVTSSIDMLKEEVDTFAYLKKREELDGNYMISNQSFDARA